MSEVEHDLHVDGHNDLEHTLTVRGVITGEVGGEQFPCGRGEDLTTVCRWGQWMKVRGERSGVIPLKVSTISGMGKVLPLDVSLLEI